MSRVSIVDLQRMKAEKEKIVVMTAYDYTVARIVDRAGVDVILVGDSGGRYALGHDDSNEVTVDEMVIMARAAARGSERAMVVGDMPFMSYQVNDEQAVVNAGRLIQEAGVQSVKLEVGAEYASTVAAIVKAGIPVMAHMGSTPMANIGAGDFRSGSVDEEQVWRDARELVNAGSFSLLLTGISADLAQRITAEVRVPTIAGFGAGDHCDGQIGVTHPTIGLASDELDRRRSNYGPVAVALLEAAEQFTQDVRAGKPVRSKRDSG